MVSPRPWLFVVGGYVAEGTCRNGFASRVNDVEICSQRVGVGDLLEVGPLGFDVAEQCFEPCLVRRGAGPAEARRYGAEGEEPRVVPARIWGPLSDHGQQDRPRRCRRLGGRGRLGGPRRGPQAFGVRASVKRLDLGGGLLAGDEGGEPFAGPTRGWLRPVRARGSGLCRRSRSGGALTRSVRQGPRRCRVRCGRAGRTSPWARERDTASTVTPRPGSRMSRGCELAVAAVDVAPALEQLTIARRSVGVMAWTPCNPQCCRRGGPRLAVAASGYSCGSSSSTEKPALRQPSLRRRRRGPTEPLWCRLRHAGARSGHPQRSFPSNKVTFTAISLNASPAGRLVSGHHQLRVDTAGSRPRPRRHQRVQSALLGDLRARMIVERSTPQWSAARPRSSHQMALPNPT